MESSANAREPWYTRAWDIIWRETVKYIWPLVLPLLFTWISQRTHQMPNALIHPAEYWLETSTIFFGSIFMVVSTGKLVVLGVSRFKRWRHPPSLQIIAHGGSSAAVELQHSGESATWEARMRILKMLDNSPNPNPLLRQCYLRKDSNEFRALLLSDGDTASVRLAYIERSHPMSYQTEIFVEVPNADDPFPTTIGSDAIIEVNLSTKPRIKRFSIKKCFLVGMVSASTMKCSEVPCTREMVEAERH
jgi:hypothetical protein